MSLIRATVPRTKVCSKCGHRKYVSHFKKHPETADGLDPRCKACVRRLYGRPKKAGICVDCDRSCHARRRRCEACRLKHQAAAEAAMVTAVGAGDAPSICTLPVYGGRCGQALSFGTDFLGRSTTWCAVHGERLMRIIGVRHYDQRDTLTLELAGFVERSKQAPKHVENVSGMHYRRVSNAYRSHPWTQQKRGAA